jgi:hypothetical protein
MQPFFTTGLRNLSAANCRKRRTHKNTCSTVAAFMTAPLILVFSTVSVWGFALMASRNKSIFRNCSIFHAFSCEDHRGSPDAMVWMDTDCLCP